MARERCGGACSCGVRRQAGELRDECLGDLKYVVLRLAINRLFHLHHELRLLNRCLWNASVLLHI